MADKLEKLRDAVRRQRDLDFQVHDASEQLAAFKAAVYLLQHKELPDLFFETGVDKVGLPAEGNFPAYEAKLTPYYHAGIAASWPPERKQLAFNWLEKNGHGDIIKNVITVRLGRGDRETAKKVCAALKKLGVDYSVDLSVHQMTLTAFLKEQVENGTMPPLELLGAEVGSMVKLKERKDGK